MVLHRRRRHRVLEPRDAAPGAVDRGGSPAGAAGPGGGEGHVGRATSTLDAGGRRHAGGRRGRPGRGNRGERFPPRKAPVAVPVAEELVVGLRRERERQHRRRQARAAPGVARRETEVGPLFHAAVASRAIGEQEPAATAPREVGGPEGRGDLRGVVADEPVGLLLLGPRRQRVVVPGQERRARARSRVEEGPLPVAVEDRGVRVAKGGRVGIQRARDVPATPERVGHVGHAVAIVVAPARLPGHVLGLAGVLEARVLHLADGRREAVVPPLGVLDRVWALGQARADGRARDPALLAAAVVAGREHRLPVRGERRLVGLHRRGQRHPLRHVEEGRLAAVPHPGGDALGAVEELQRREVLVGGGNTRSTRPSPSMSAHWRCRNSSPPAPSSRGSRSRASSSSHSR